MAVHKYLFLIENNFMTVFNNNNDDMQNLDILTDCGEKTFPIKEDFWSWWKNAASFNEKEDSADFAFLYDCYNPVIAHTLPERESSCWSFARIADFIKAKVEYTALELVINSGEADERIIAFNRTRGKKLPKKLFLDRHIGDIEKIIADDTAPVQLSEEQCAVAAEDKGDYSPFVRYFVEKLEKEEQER